MTTMRPQALQAYEAAMNVIALAPRLWQDLPGRRGRLGVDLRRAAIAIPLNIADGYGQHNAIARRHFFRAARDAARRCQILLERARQHRLIPDPALSDARAQLARVVALLDADSTQARAVRSEAVTTPLRPVPRPEPRPRSPSPRTCAAGGGPRFS